MKHTMREDSGRLTVTLDGDFNFANAASFQPVLSALSKETISECELNVSGLTFMDSTAVSLFLAAHDALRGRGGTLSIRGAQGPVLDILKRVKIEKLITMV